MQQYYLEEKEVSRFLTALNAEFKLLETVESTNDYLKEQIKTGLLRKTTVVVAIEQTKGRGTKGRSWVSDKESCLKMSLAIPEESAAAPTVAVSPALTLELCQRLRQKGYLEVQLKWPNDLIRNEGKLAGILLETARHREQRFLVIGIGINLFPCSVLEQTVDRKIAFLLDQAPKDQVRIRTEITKLIVGQCIETAVRVNSQGLIEDFKLWEKFDFLQGKKIKVQLNPKARIEGIDRGIDDQGRLLIQTEQGETKSLQLGEIEI